MPELAATYGLSPDQIWNLTQTEMTAFLAHHRELEKSG